MNTQDNTRKKINLKSSLYNKKEMSSFLDAKIKFDQEHKNKDLTKCIVPVNGKILSDIRIKNNKREHIEEYYKWQFINSIINSGLYSKDYIGAEVHFPKGNKSSAPLKIDTCIFDDKNWINHYTKWQNSKDEDAVDWLRKHLICAIEFKKSKGKDVKTVFTVQVKPELKESESEYCLAVYYDTERLYLFHKRDGLILRYDESKNQKGDESTTNDFSLEQPDRYALMPSFTQLVNRINKPSTIDRGKRTVNDLEIISGVHSQQINTVLSNILRDFDKVSLAHTEQGYKILIQMMAMKIFDEKRSKQTSDYLEFYITHKEQEKTNLLFYITESERNWTKLSDQDIQNFVQRMQELAESADPMYSPILKQNAIFWKDEGHVKAVSSIVANLQDYSFINSAQTDLYQLVFYRFASEFSKAAKGQFVTPLKLIEFLVKIVNPKRNELVIDPTVGIADFLAFTYINTNGSIQDSNLFGVDNDKDMIMLAQLNMLLNGDGGAQLIYQPDKGSILHKFSTDRKLVELDTKMHRKGNWDNWADTTKLLKFDVVLTNPPFGNDRKWEPETQRDKEIAELYELWYEARTGESVDLGLLFLENACRCLGKNGRLGIVLSNSIASVDKYDKARQWLLRKMRVVATFDLPAGAFADTGVNTTLLVAYKPTESELKRLQDQDYEIFTRNIKNIGYEVQTDKRVKSYREILKINENFDVEINEEGDKVVDEEFTQTIKDFKDWTLTQEETLQKIFL